MNQPQHERSPLFSKAEAALRQATRKLILEAQKTGRRLIVWENGRVAEVPGTRFRVDADNTHNISDKEGGVPVNLTDHTLRRSEETMNDEHILKKAVTLLFEEAPPGSRVILFGSRATGQARPDSDWDFLVVEPEVKNRLAEMARLSACLGEALIPADVVVMSREAFERRQGIPNTLPALAQKEGRIYESVP